MAQKTARRAGRASADTAAPENQEGPRLLIICLVIVLGGVGLILAEVWYLRARRADRRVAWADEAVTARVEEYRRLLAQGQRDEAVRQLEMALLIDGARNKEEARHLLHQIEQQKAAVILGSAR